MANIYQLIWNADQAGAGVPAIFSDQSGDAARGYVQVNRAVGEAAPGPEFRVLTDAKIPASKIRTYDLCRAMFDNYALDEQALEVETPEEREETHNLLQAMVDTPPMQVARAYVEEATGTTISIERWYATLLEMWFRRFSQGGDPALSGFEHVVVGEQEGPKTQGYHFWYKYYLDDGFAREVDGTSRRFPGLKDDRIIYLGSKEERDQPRFPESVTISYRWDAADYDAMAVRPLIKKVGGFFVGCSVEGLLALGTVRAHLGARAPKEAVINGARYQLVVYRSPDDKNVRTFYPKFLGAAAAEEGEDTLPGSSLPGSPPDDTAAGTVTGGLAGTVTGPVRIIAALLNPFGDDAGQEVVTLINTGPSPLPLAGWRLLDKNRNHFEISDLTLAGGRTTAIVLPPNTMQMSNKGGEIVLVDRAGDVVHRVSYSQEQASRQGETTLF